MTSRREKKVTKMSKSSNFNAPLYRVLTEAGMASHDAKIVASAKTPEEREKLKKELMEKTLLKKEEQFEKKTREQSQRQKYADKLPPTSKNRYFGLIEARKISPEEAYEIVALEVAASKRNTKSKVILRRRKK